MNRQKTTLTVVLAILVMIATICPMAIAKKASRPQTITFDSLLEEMVDRDAITRFPDPKFRLLQASSYDRGTKDPHEDNDKGWFANIDRSQFIRTEVNSGRDEWVIMDYKGPGAVARMWLTGNNVGKTIRFYFDGSDKPAIEGDAVGLFNNSPTALLGYPFTHTSSGSDKNEDLARSAVSFIPIPFAKGLKVTLDQEPMYYIITYRAYDKAVPVRSFSLKDLKTQKALLDRTAKELVADLENEAGNVETLRVTVGPGKEATLDLPGGEKVVRYISLAIDETDKQAFRSTVIKAHFDDRLRIWSAVGDFFGTGLGVNPFKGRYRQVDADGLMKCSWLMPYRHQGSVSILNLGKTAVTIVLRAGVSDHKWTDETMYFNAGWRHRYPIATLPRSEYNFIEAEGKGVYVGDTLTVINPIIGWWGEGDAHIFVDGETFPSMLGTGTEDYYAYAYGGRNRAFFQHPFHAQVRAAQFNRDKMDGYDFTRNTKGITTLTRTRALDTIPFESSLTLNIEVWHWLGAKMDYANCSYWYAFDQTAANLGPERWEAMRRVPIPPPLVTPVR